MFGTASHPDKLALLKRLDVDHPINYQAHDFAQVIREAQSGGGVDVVLELVGGETFRKSRELLNPFGRLVIAGMAGLKLEQAQPPDVADRCCAIFRSLIHCRWRSVRLG